MTFWKSEFLRGCFATTGRAPRKTLGIQTGFTLGQRTTRLDTMNERIDSLQADMNRRFDTIQAENQRQHDAMQEVLRVFEGRITRLEEKVDISPENVE